MTAKPEYQAYFEFLNLDWFKEYFSIEPIDRLVAGNPEEDILEEECNVVFSKE